MIYVDATGAHIPALGFGTYQLEGAACRDATSRALAAGYRHIDTAQMYGNESEVGAALRGADASRDAIWLTTKLGRDNVSPARVQQSVRDSLKRLGTDYVDLLLIHWPDDTVPLADTLGAMMGLQREGLTRFIGVSNFTPRLMEEALTLAPVVCNQVEYHPYLGREPLLRIARDSDTALVAYSPLAQAKVVADDVLGEIGARHDKSAAQVALRWLLQQKMVVAIPKARTEEHMLANMDVFDFELEEREMTAIGELDEGERLIDPSWAPRWGEPAPPSLTERRRRKLASGRARDIESQPSPHAWVMDTPAESR